MSLLDTMYNLVDGLQSRLSQGVDVAARDLSEVDSTPEAMLNMVRFTKPLIGLE